MTIRQQLKNAAATMAERLSDTAEKRRRLAEAESQRQQQHATALAAHDAEYEKVVEHLRYHEEIERQMGAMVRTRAGMARRDAEAREAHERAMHHAAPRPLASLISALEAEVVGIAGIRDVGGQPDKLARRQALGEVLDQARPLVMACMTDSELAAALDGLREQLDARTEQHLAERQAVEVAAERAARARALGGR